MKKSWIIKRGHGSCGKVIDYAKNCVVRKVMDYVPGCLPGMEITNLEKQHKTTKKSMKFDQKLRNFDLKKN